MKKRNLHDGTIVEDKNGVRGIIVRNTMVDLYGRKLRDLRVLDEDCCWHGIPVIVKIIIL